MHDTDNFIPSFHIPRQERELTEALYLKIPVTVAHLALKLFYLLDLFLSVYLLYAVPGLILAAAVSFYTTSTFTKFSKVIYSSGLSGAGAGKRILEYAVLYLI